MLARLVDEPVSGPQWLFEPKLDGYRILVNAHSHDTGLSDHGGDWPQDPVTRQQR